MRPAVDEPTTTLYPLIDPELISTFYDPTDLYIHLVPIYYPIKGEYRSVDEYTCLYS